MACLRIPRGVIRPSLLDEASHKRADSIRTYELQTHRGYQCGASSYERLGYHSKAEQSRLFSRQGGCYNESFVSSVRGFLLQNLLCQQSECEEVECFGEQYEVMS